MATTVRLLQRKAFSLPKLALFPSVALAQPLFVAGSLPLALIVDSVKSKGIARLSAALEELKREEKRVEAVRSRVQVKPRFGAGGSRLIKERILCVSFLLFHLFLFINARP